MAKLVSQTTVNRNARNVASLNREAQRFNALRDDRYEKAPVVMSAVTAGRNQVQINGGIYPAEGITGQGAAVAVVNVGTAAVAKYVPANRRSVESLAGSGRGGSGGGGGGGSVPSPHDLDGVHHAGTLSWVKVNKSGSSLTDIATRPHSALTGIGANDHHAQQHNILGGDHTITATNFQLVGSVGTNTLGLHTPSANPGATASILRTAGDGSLVIGSTLLNINATTNAISMDGGLVIVNGASDAVTFDTTLMVVNASTDIVSFDTSLLTINAATDVVAFGSTLLAVSVAANTVAIDTSVMVVDATANTVAFDTSVLVVNANTDTVTMDGTLFVANASTDIVTFDGTVLAINAATDIVTFDTTLMVVNASANTITMDTNLFVLDAGANTITSAAAWTFNGNIIANLDVTHNTGVFRHNTDPQVNADLDFIGGNRAITASNTLTISPTTDLVFDPGGLVLLPNAQELRTSTFSDLVTGITGMRMWDRGSNYRQITLGALKADEMYVRIFVADETRIDRGEEFWSKSYGVVETDFVLPADEATVDVWFENAPALAAANLFSVNDWLLARTIDWDTSLTIEKIWFQVVSLLTAGSVDGYRQQWRLRRKSGGTTSSVVKKGNTFLDSGQVGQGWVHLSALDQDGGPFVQVGDFTSISSDTPQFTNRVRMGNLNGTVDYSADTWGFAAGDDLGTTPSAGFSGITSDATNGARLFNTSIMIYNSSTLALSIDKNVGIRMLQDGSAYGDGRRYIKWYDSIEPLGNLVGELLSYTQGGSQYMQLREVGAGASVDASVIVKAEHGAKSATLTLTGATAGDGTATLVSSDFLLLNSTRVRIEASTGIYLKRQTFIGAIGATFPTIASTAHIYEDTTSTGASAGLTVEQAGTGDAVAQFLLGSGQRWVLGTDNSDGDAFKLASGTDLGTNTIFRIDPALTIGLGRNTTISGTLGVTGIATVGDTTYVEPYTGFNAQNNRVVVVRYATAHATSTPYTGFVFANNVTDTTDGVHSFLVFQNEAIGGGEQRLAQLVMRTDNGLDGGQYRFTVFNAGASIDAMTIRKTGYVGVMISSPVSPFHLYEDTANVGTNAGATIENDGTGDAVLQLLLTGGRRWVMGIDNSLANDPLVWSASADLSSSPLMALTNTGSLGVGTATPGVDIISTTDHAADRLLHINGTQPSVLIRGSSQADLDLINTGSASNERWFRIRNKSNRVEFQAVDNGDSGYTSALAIKLSNGYVGMGGELSPSAYLDVAESDTTGIRATTYGNTAWFNFVARRAAGSLGGPSAVSSGQMIGAWGAQGYGSSGWPANVQVEMQAQATENYTSTGRGAKLTFATTANGATSPTVRVEIGQDGSLVVPYIWATAVNGTAVQINSNGILTKATSSKRFKKNIRPLVGFGDDFIMALKPVIYNNKYGDDASDYVGFVAEDVYESGGAPFISLNNGLVESLHYDKLTVPLVGATQRLIRDREDDRSELRKLKARIAELERRLN